MKDLFMRQRVIPSVVLIVCLGGLLGVVVVVAWSHPRREPGLTLENFRRLQVGMMREQVEAILGRDPVIWSEGAYRSSGDYCFRPYHISVTYQDNKLIDAIFRPEQGELLEVKEPPPLYVTLLLLFDTPSAGRLLD